MNLPPCSTCGKPVEMIERGQTLVGFMSPPGHDHDDNCLRLRLRCEDGHVTTLHPRRRCHVDGCEWIGRLVCFCTAGEKTPTWVNTKGLP